MMFCHSNKDDLVSLQFPTIKSGYTHTAQTQPMLISIYHWYSQVLLYKTIVPILSIYTHVLSLPSVWDAFLPCYENTFRLPRLSDSSSLDLLPIILLLATWKYYPLC